jgi:hypothetical protein
MGDRTHGEQLLEDGVLVGRDGANLCERRREPLLRH